jgi:hypothetical protein
MSIELPNGHSVNTSAKSIPCCGGANRQCGNAAAWCEYMRWKPHGIAFYYYCEECWTVPGPHGDTPKNRAHKP